jgi:hypothetical protein
METRKNHVIELLIRLCSIVLIATIAELITGLPTEAVIILAVFATLVVYLSLRRVT